MNERTRREANVAKIQLDVPKEGYRKRDIDVKYDMTGLQREEVASKYKRDLDNILSKGCQEN